MHLYKLNPENGFMLEENTMSVVAYAQYNISAILISGDPERSSKASVLTPQNSLRSIDGFNDLAKEHLAPLIAALRSQGFNAEFHERMEDSEKYIVIMIPHAATAYPSLAEATKAYTELERFLIGGPKEQVAKLTSSHPNAIKIQTIVTEQLLMFAEKHWAEYAKANRAKLAAASSIAPNVETTFNRGRTAGEEGMPVVSRERSFTP